MTRKGRLDAATISFGYFLSLVLKRGGMNVFVCETMPEEEWEEQDEDEVDG